MKEIRDRHSWEKVDVARGMAVYDPSEDETIGDVVRRADKLMYENKWQRKHTGMKSGMQEITELS